MADDPRNVSITHPDHGTIKVTPEVAAALEAGNYGPWKRDQEEALQARIAELEAELAAVKGGDPAGPGQEDMPEGAADRKKWIGNDPARAQAALDEEQARGDNARQTVTDHARSVLDTTQTNDPAGPGQED